MKKLEMRRRRFGGRAQEAELSEAVLQLSAKQGLIAEATANAVTECEL
jgi:hypothetical protein